jgi:hypothetical protein
MGLYGFMEKKMKNLKAYDISILKLSVFAFALWLAIVWPTILGLPTWVYLLVWVVAWVYLVWKMFF